MCLFLCFLLIYYLNIFPLGYQDKMFSEKFGLDFFFFLLYFPIEENNLQRNAFYWIPFKKQSALRYHVIRIIASSSITCKRNFSPFVLQNNFNKFTLRKWIDLEESGKNTVKRKKSRNDYSYLYAIFNDMSINLKIILNAIYFMNFIRREQ